MWTCGDFVDDYFGRMVKEAKRVGHTNRHACINLVTKIPHEVHPACEQWISEAAENVSDKDARTFIKKVRTILAEKGIPVDTGYRQVNTVKVTSIRGKEDEDPSSGASEEEVTPKVQTTRVWDGRQVTHNTTNPYKCFTCSQKGHGWRQCPERSCNRCGRKGHEVSRCPKILGPQRRGQSGGVRSDYQGKVMAIEEPDHSQSNPLAGGTPLFRARTAMSDTTIAAVECCNRLSMLTLS